MSKLETGSNLTPRDRQMIEAFLRSQPPNANGLNLHYEIPDWRVTSSDECQLGCHENKRPAQRFAAKTALPRPDTFVRSIPSIMKGMGWQKSADVMDKWFSLPARQMSDAEKVDASLLSAFPAQYIDTTLFTWSWLQRFNRVNKAVELLMGNLETPNAKNQLLRSLRAGLKTAPKVSRSNWQIRQERTPNVVELHQKDQLQLQRVGYETGVMDDLYGSLGRFAIYAALSKVDMSVSGTTARATVKEVFLYMKDTFDFNGSQYLGHWSDSGMGINVMAGGADKLAGIEWALPAYNSSIGWARAIGNSDFNRYRDLSGMGGDLMLFSDLRSETVNISLEFTI